MSSFWRRAAVAAAAATAAGLVPVAGLAAGTPSRVALPDPTVVSAILGKPVALPGTQPLSLRVYLAGQPGRAAAALAVSDPRNPQYAHFLTAAQFLNRYGATPTQIKSVAAWLTAEGMKITTATEHYIAVTATVAQADAAFDTRVSKYQFPPVIIKGHKFPGGYEVGTVGGFSVPLALGGDIATVTGLENTVLPTTSPVPPAPVKPGAQTPSGGSTPGYRCSHYWGQHTENIPAAYGHTSAVTQLCGYTPGQLRQAYGVATSSYTGKGVTVAIVLVDRSPTMLADANKFFASHGEAGFAPGQFSQNIPPSVARTCKGSGEEGYNALEESMDVEAVHTAAPDAKVVYVAGDCDPQHPAAGGNPLLDAATRVVDQHLANVVSGSFSDGELAYSPADGAAWNLTFEQGALEGIGFNLSSGDGGSDINPYPPHFPASICFPSSSPWVTSVGGTSVAIGSNGAQVADYPWGDNITQVDPAGTGYTAPPPGKFINGSTGGRSALYPEPAYQKPVVPAALATVDGTEPARRVVPDISANAGSPIWIGYTGAVKNHVYGQTLSGGTSESAPFMAGLEADAIQAAGHPLGFLNPALYQLAGSSAISDVLPVSRTNPPVVIGDQPGLGPGTADNYLTTLGEDQRPLKAARGYDDATGLGAPASSFVTAFGRFGIGGH